MSAFQSAIDIRNAGIDDAATLAQLLSEMDDAPASQVTPDAIEHMRAVLADMAAYPDFRVYLLCRDGVPVGSFSLMVFASPSHQGTPQAMLDGVVVARSVRGAGLGQRMIRHAMTLAADAGCYKMSLSSNLKRADAHRFYQQLGFVQHGVSLSIALM